jgi:hypothetical protein
MPIETEYEQSEKEIVKQALREHYAETVKERTEFYEKLVEQIVQKKLARVGMWSVVVILTAIGAIVMYVANLIGGHK